jgi:Ran GTPase-activating protein (RanGAP) involved in mRNA processing and transport
MEKFDHSKHKPFLLIMELLEHLPRWGNLQVIFQDVCDYYDNKFEIVEVKDREGNTIKCL